MKKFVVFVLSVVLAYSMSLPTLATENTNDNSVGGISSHYTIEERLSDAYYGVIDAEVDEKLLKSISICVDSGCEGEYSLLEFADDTDPYTYAVRELGEAYENGESVGTVYALTASGKPISDSTTQNGVYAWISLVWIDHFGVDNELVSISGGWTPNGHTIAKRYVKYTVADFMNSSGHSISARPTSNTYSYDIGASGYSFSAEAEATIDGSTTRITVSVETTIRN